MHQDGQHRQLALRMCHTTRLCPTLSRRTTRGLGRKPYSSSSNVIFSNMHRHLSLSRGHRSIVRFPCEIIEFPNCSFLKAFPDIGPRPLPENPFLRSPRRRVPIGIEHRPRPPFSSGSAPGAHNEREETRAEEATSTRGRARPNQRRGKYIFAKCKTYRPGSSYEINA